MYIFNKKEANYKNDYVKITEDLNEAQRDKDEEFLRKRISVLSRYDLFFLLYFVLDVRPINHPWLVDRVREIEDSHDRTLDLWAREHYKSTIITYALTIQKILKDQNVRCAIFSNTKGLAKKFLRRIKLTFQTNELLKATFPEILYENPETQSPKWSEDDGLLVKRTGTASFQEMTLEAHGVTEAMPVGMHYTERIYDDLVTWDSTRTGEQIRKTKEGFEMSHNLGITKGVGNEGYVRIIGTRYDFHDLYSDLIKGGDWNVREHPGDQAPKCYLSEAVKKHPRYVAVDKPFWDEEIIDQKKKDLGKYTFATQISLKPVSEDEQRFEIDWLQYYTVAPSPLNKYILVDPAGDSRKKGSSYTVMHVVGVDWNKNKYLLDMARDKLSMKEKWEVLRDLFLKHSEGSSTVMNVGYEKYSMQADIAAIQEWQLDEHIVFGIQELGGNVSKKDRIRNALVPDFQYGKWYLPKEYWYTDKQGKTRDLIKEFIEEEYKHFPNVTYFDMLDALARIGDEKLGVVYPSAPARVVEKTTLPYWMPTRRKRHLNWMAR